MTKLNSFRSLWARLHNAGFVRNVSVLAGGTALSQGLTILAFPILTRLYMPDSFGILEVYVSIVSTLASISSLYYMLAIVLPKEEQDAANVLLLTIGIVGGISLVAFALVIFLRDPIATLLGEPRIALWLWLVPLTLLATGLYQNFNYWFTRKKQFSCLAAAQFIRSITTVVIQLGVAILFRADVAGLVGGYTIGQIVATTVLGIRIWQEDGTFIYQHASIRRMKAQAIRYRKYPIFDSWPSFCANFMHTLPVLFLTRFYGADITGYYALSKRIFSMSSTLVSRSIAQVLFQNIAEKQAQTRDISRDVEKAFRWLFLIAILFLVGMLVVSVFFAVIFGQDWIIAGEYARIMAPAFALMFVVSPMSLILGVVNRQELSAVWQVAALIITAISLWMSLFFGNARASIILLSLNNLILYSIYAYLILYASKANFRRTIMPWREESTSLFGKNEKQRVLQ